MAYHEVADVGGFLRALAGRGLTRAVIAWQEEYAQHPSPDAVRYERVRLLTLLAYDPADGCILRCGLDGADRAAVRSRLEAAGIAVEERSRNLV
jgi:hypothetical protein